MKHWIVVSRYPNSPHYKIEGTGYASQKEAKRFIELFKARELALDEVQKEFDPTSRMAFRQYGLGELSILDIFFQD